MGTELVVFSRWHSMNVGGVDPSLLARICSDAEAHFGVGPISLLPMQTQDRPFSVVVRLAVVTRERQNPVSHVFAKTYKPIPNRDMEERVTKEFEATKRIHALMAPFDKLGAAQPIACYPEELTLVTEEVPGTDLLQHLATRAAWFPSARSLDDLCETMQAVGRWVRVFQSSQGVGPKLTFNDVSNYVDHRLRRLVDFNGSGFSLRDRERVLEHVAALMNRVPAEALVSVPVHGDMALSNVLVADGRVAVLDFSMGRFESYLLDLTRLFLQTELLSLKPRFRAPVVRRLQGALLEGFDPLLDEQLAAFRLSLLIHRINNLATAILRPSGRWEALYYRVVRRHHVRSLEAELRAPIAA